jgi:hypothetical protein
MEVGFVFLVKPEFVMRKHVRITGLVLGHLISEEGNVVFLTNLG